MPLQLIFTVKTQLMCDIPRLALHLVIQNHLKDLHASYWSYYALLQELSNSKITGKNLSAQNKKHKQLLVKKHPATLL